MSGEPDQDFAAGKYTVIRVEFVPLTRTGKLTIAAPCWPSQEVDLSPVPDGIEPSVLVSLEIGFCPLVTNPNKMGVLLANKPIGNIVLKNEAAGVNEPVITLFDNPAFFAEALRKAEDEKMERLKLASVYGDPFQLIGGPSCSYCGKAYPPGTPNSELQEHVKVCEAHPLAEALKNLAILRAACVEAAGTDDVDELKRMEATLEAASKVDPDAKGALAITRALLQVRP